MFMKKPIKNKIIKDWVKKQRILQTKGIKEETSRHKKFIYYLNKLFSIQRIRVGKVLWS